jgi:hypothetical protein
MIRFCRGSSRIFCVVIVGIERKSKNYFLIVKKVGELDEDTSKEVCDILQEMFAY